MKSSYVDESYYLQWRPGNVSALQTVTIPITETFDQTGQTVRMMGTQPSPAEAYKETSQQISCHFTAINMDPLTDKTVTNLRVESGDSSVTPDALRQTDYVLPSGATQKIPLTMTVAANTAPKLVPITLYYTLEEKEYSQTIYLSVTGNTRKVNFELNGGNWVSGYNAPVNYQEGVALELPTAGNLEKTGQYFAGWYSDASLTGNPVAKIGTTSTGDKTYYAKWSNLAIAPDILTTTLYNGIKDTAFSQTLTATGTMPITWSIASGSLPDGLTLDGETGIISGTPTTAGQYTVKIKAENSAGSDDQELTMTVNGPPTITSAGELSVGGVGKAYSQTLTATSTTPVTWSIASGSLPDGLTLNPSTGKISGTPTVAVYSRAITVKASNGFGTDVSAIYITIGIPPEITTTALDNGEVGKTYNVSIEATGDNSNVTWRISSGQLPEGLTLGKNDYGRGIISGTPTTVGKYTFTVTDQNDFGSDSQELTITITSPPVAPTIITTSLPDGIVETAYEQTLAADGTTPMTWSVVGGSLPAGLSLSEDGKITGTPTAGGSSSFTVKAKNAAGEITKELSIVVKIPTYTITSSVNDETKGSITPSGTVQLDRNKDQIFTFTAKEGYVLDYLLIDGQKVTVTNNSYTFEKVTADHTIQAVFAVKPYSVTVNTSEGGTASATPATAVAGTKITLSATPDKGYTFKEWEVVSGGVTITDNSFTMPGSDVTVKAVFAVKPYSVTVNTSEGGTASATPATAVAGTKITLSATPDKGYTFKEWEVVSGGGYHHGQQLYHAGKRRHGEGRLCGETVQRYRQHQ